MLGKALSSPTTLWKLLVGTIVIQALGLCAPLQPIIEPLLVFAFPATVAIGFRLRHLHKAGQAEKPKPVQRPSRPQIGFDGCDPARVVTLMAPDLSPEQASWNLMHSLVHVLAAGHSFLKTPADRSAMTEIFFELPFFQLEHRVEGDGHFTAYFFATSSTYTVRVIGYVTTVEARTPGAPATQHIAIVSVDSNGPRPVPASVPKKSTTAAKKTATKKSTAKKVAAAAAKKAAAAARKATAAKKTTSAPTKTAPAKAAAAKAVPVKAAPAKTTPAKAAPAKAAPAKTTPAKAAPAKTTPAKTTPAKAAPAKAAPAKAAPAKAAPAKAAPVKAAPAKTTPAKAAPAKAAPAKTTPAKTTPAKAAPAKGASHHVRPASPPAGTI